MLQRLFSNKHFNVSLHSVVIKKHQYEHGFYKQMATLMKLNFEQRHDPKSKKTSGFKKKLNDKNYYNV